MERWLLKLVVLYHCWVFPTLSFSSLCDCLYLLFICDFTQFCVCNLSYPSTFYMLYLGTCFRRPVFSHLLFILFPCCPCLTAAFYVSSKHTFIQGRKKIKIRVCVGCHDQLPLSKSPPGPSKCYVKVYEVWHWQECDQNKKQALSADEGYYFTGNSYRKRHEVGTPTITFSISFDIVDFSTFLIYPIKLNIKNCD